MRGHTWAWHRTAAPEAATISGQERHSHGRFWSPGPKQREDAEMKTHLMARTHPPTNGSPARRLRYRREQGWLCLVPLMPAFTPTPPGTALGCGRASTAVPARGRLLQAAARPRAPQPQAAVLASAAGRALSTIRTVSSGDEFTRGPAGEATANGTCPTSTRARNSLGPKHGLERRERGVRRMRAGRVTTGGPGNALPVPTQAARYKILLEKLNFRRGVGWR